MNKQLKVLFKVNLLYLNPQYTQKLRKKNKTSREIIQSLLMQFGLSSLLLGVVYGLIIIMIDFSKLPGLFTFYLALFVAMSFSQMMMSIYNVFFQSKDLASYAPLPLDTKKVFLAKVLVVSYSSLAFLIPAFILFLVTSIRARVYVPLAIVLSLVLFIFLFTLLFELGVLLIFALVNSPLYKKYQKTMNAVLVFLPNLLMLVAIFGINFNNNADITQDRFVIPLLVYFYKVSTVPLKLSSLLIFVSLLFILGLLYHLIKISVLPRLFDIPTPVASKRRRRKGADLSLPRVLRHYNTGLINDPTLLTQTIFSSVIAPMILIINLVINRDVLKLVPLPDNMLGLALMAGLLLAGMTINGTSLISNLISLDKDNYEFITSLPLAKAVYLKNKFWFGFTLHALINCLFVIIFVFLLKLPLIYASLLLIGNLLGSYLYCQHYFYRDYRLLSLKWTNVSQLFNRGMGNFGTFLSIFGTSMLLLLVSIGYVILLLFYPNFTFWINFVMMALIISLSTVIHFWIKQHFWKRL